MRRLFIIGAASSSALLAACGRAGPAVSSGVPAPEHRVEASSGPVHIELSLLRGRAKIEPNNGWKQAHVFYRVKLENAGNDPVPCDSSVFGHPEEGGSAGIFLEVVDEKGAPAPEWAFIPSHGEGSPSLGPDFAKPRFCWLDPGGVRTSTTAVHQLSAAVPVEGYGELPFRLDTPGRYRARLVFDMTVLKEEKKRQNRDVRIWEVKVATPYIPFDVE